MTTQALHAHRLHAGTAPPAAGLWRVVRFVTEHYLALPIGAAIALVWANTLPESYFTFAYRLAFPVNEIAMVFFFGLVAQEIFEELMPGGALHQWRRWVVPVVGAAGGVAGAAIVYGLYLTWHWTPLLHAGWPVVAGVDLVFAYFIARSLFPRHPAVSFVLLLAVASNALAVLAIAPTYMAADARAGGAALLMAGAVGVAAWLRQRCVREFWPYLFVAGGLSWLALYVEGFHAGLALVPIVPFMPHVRRRLDELLDDEADARGASPRHFEHVWHYHVQVALLLFGLVNAGVLLSGYGPGTWATLAASLVGRTVGILAAVGAAVAIGLHLPAHLRWRELTVVALIASTGFTFSLFFATALYPAGPLLAELKVGALLTASGVLLALAAARLTHVGRFAPQRSHARPHTRHRHA